MHQTKARLQTCQLNHLSFNSTLNFTSFYNRSKKLRPYISRSRPKKKTKEKVEKSADPNNKKDPNAPKEKKLSILQKLKMKFNS